MRSSSILLSLFSAASAVLFEAESAVKSGALTTESSVTGFTGTGYVTNWLATETLTFSVTGLTAGSYDIGIVYSAPYGDKFTQITVNSGSTSDIAILSTTTPAWTTAKTGSHTLTSGTNTVVLTAFWGYYLIDSISVVPTPPKAVTVVDVTLGAKVEAEDGAYNGVMTGTSVAGFSGTGYVESFDGATDTLTLSVSSTAQALYNIVVRYSAPYGGKQTTMVLNGGSSSNVVFEDMTGSTILWKDANAGQVLLKAGVNTLQFQTNWGWYLIDYLQITPAPAPPPHQVTSSLVIPNPLPVAVALYNKLRSLYGTGVIISGQAENSGVSWIETNLGKTPAIIGLDLMDYSPSRVAFMGDTAHSVEEAIAWDARNGIVSIQWHWNAPTDLINNDTVKWWSGFYTYATTFNLTAALVPTSPNYALLIRDIDAIAVQLLRLQAAGVPVLWRPLHEAEGGWFWWGAFGPESCKALYNIVYQRLTVHHNLRNLIWVWNSVSPAWYPGNAVVDIVGYDSYPPQGDHGPVSVQWQQLVALVGDTKIVTLPEVGTIPDPDLLKLYHADWSYFVTWSGEFIESNIHNDLAFKQKVYNDPTVLKLSDLGNWKGPSTSTTASRTSTTLATTTRSTTASTTTTVSRTTTVVTTTTTGSSSSTTKSTTKSTTPIITTTRTTTAAPTTTSANGALAQRWGQCGGDVNYTGPRACVAPWVCTFSNPFYSQCL